MYFNLELNVWAHSSHVNVSPDFALPIAFKACLSFDCCFRAFMFRGATLGVGVSVAAEFTFPTEAVFFSVAVAFRTGAGVFFAEVLSFLTGNDFLAEAAFLPTAEALHMGTEALRVRLTFGGFSYDSSDPLQLESALSRLKSSSELLLLTYRTAAALRVRLDLRIESAGTGTVFNRIFMGFFLLPPVAG